MPRRTRVGLTDRYRTIGPFLHALVSRDPLTRNLFDSFDPKLEEESPGYREYEAEIAHKWGVDVKLHPPQPHELSDDQIPERIRHLKNKKPWDRFDLEAWRQWMFDAGIRPKYLGISFSWWPLRWTVNRGCVVAGVERGILDSPKGHTPRGFYDRLTSGCKELSQGGHVEDWDGHHCVPCFGRLKVPLHQAHVLNVEVDLTAMTFRHLEDVAREFKAIVRHVLPFAPKTSKEEGLQALAFLRTITPKTFDRAITAYDLHMGEGLTIAEIARRLKRSQTRVEADVKRVYRAIYRKEYTARRRRLDTPARGVLAYTCPQHDRDCPKTCIYMTDWLQRVNRLLPTDTTGSGRRFR